MEKKNIQNKQIEINTNTFTGSLYSQIVSVSVTDIDITFEFSFIDNRDYKGKVVSRITMPRPSGEELAQLIVNVTKAHEKKKEENNAANE